MNKLLTSPTAVKQCGWTLKTSGGSDLIQFMAYKEEDTQSVRQCYLVKRSELYFYRAVR